MNKKRRKELDLVITTLDNCCNDLEFIKDEESDALSNMPENLENSERYQQMEENCDTMDDALSDIRGAITNLQNLE